jgi:YVTN family beta-propeller protein
MRTTATFCIAITSLLTLWACDQDPPTPDDEGAGTGGQSAQSGASHSVAGKKGYGGQATGGDPSEPGAGQAGDASAGAGGGDTGDETGNEAGGEGGAAPLPPGLQRPSRGSAVALSPDESLALAVNRDVGSVTLLGLDRSSPGAPPTSVLEELALGEGSEPWQVAIGPDNATAFVVLRKDQRLTRIRYLKTAPLADAHVAVGSEPTGLALSPSGDRVFVSNSNDGTVSVVDAKSMKLVRTIDLNAALVAGGYLGEIQARPALAHPRSITVSNDADGEDQDEALYVTEYFAQQVEPEAADGSNSDVRNVGLVYRVSLSSYAVTTIPLQPLADMGFKDANGIAAGCFPNQLQAITLNGNFAYVLSVCASPKGPLGVKATTTTCSKVEDCASLKLVEPACVVPFGGAASSICVDVAGVKTSTAPLVSIIDTRTGEEVPHSARNLNAEFTAFFDKTGVAQADRRFPLFASDLAFVPETQIAYASANGADAVFRLVFDAKLGSLVEVGASTSPFIDLTPKGIPADKSGKNPIGVAAAANPGRFAIVANDVSRNATVVDFNTQAVAGGITEPNVLATAALPVAKSREDRVLRGKRFFNTGTGRWSLAGQGWGACQSCHSDGLSDNVTWYFARGPRQATSLEGSFASHDPSDQRIFNWTAIFDEVADFEGNTRDVSGGVGAIVSALSTPPQTADRIDFVGLKHAGLNGSSTQAADPGNPLGLAAAPKLEDWQEIEAYIQTIRSPRAPSLLDPGAVARGEELFKTGGACQGCHGGAKWTISQRFYTPSTQTNTLLSTTPLLIPSGFPSALLPARQPANQLLRFAGGNAAAFDQILCAIRPVGTFNVAEPGAGIAELRADMTTIAQGDGNPAGEGRGYNPPSLLGMASGAPYLHGGQARSLEGLFGPAFHEHARALAPNFLRESDPKQVNQQIADLVQYLLSIDEDTEPLAIPAAGASGGLLCPTAF